MGILRNTIYVWALTTPSHRISVVTSLMSWAYLTVGDRVTGGQLVILSGAIQLCLVFGFVGTTYKMHRQMHIGELISINWNTPWPCIYTIITGPSFEFFSTQSSTISPSHSRLPATVPDLQFHRPVRTTYTRNNKLCSGCSSVII